MIAPLPIVRGHARGRRIGFPTLNFAIPRGFPYPYGIYAGTVMIDGAPRHAAFHYGPVPTFGSRTPTLEAFLLGPRPLRVPRRAAIELLAYVRPVRRFPGGQALARQIAADVGEIKRIFGTDG